MKWNIGEVGGVILQYGILKQSPSTEVNSLWDYAGADLEGGGRGGSLDPPP